MDCPIFNVNLHSYYYNNPECGNDYYRFEITTVSGESIDAISGVIQYFADGFPHNLHLINDNNSTTELYYQGSGNEIQNGFDVYIYSNNGTCVAHLSQPFVDCTESEPESNSGNYCFTTTCDGNWILPNFIRGCTNPQSPNYNPNATIDDGNCTNVILGCMNPLAVNYNPNATTDDGSCFFAGGGGSSSIISGCTDNRYIEYNPNATVDDGSCLNLKYGCNNPLAANYNPNATYNDGSCIFVSGCTNENAPNYNPNAVVDNGTCLCNNPTFVFDKRYIYNPNCEYEVDLTLNFKIDANSFLNYIAANDKTIVDTTNLLNFDVCFFNISTNSCVNEVFDKNLFITGSTDFVSLFNEILSVELNKDCNFNYKEYYFEKNQNFKIPVPNTFSGTQFGFYIKYNNVFYNFQSDIVDLKVIQNCKEEVTTNTLVVPKIKVKKIINNKKSNLLDKKVLNTKETDIYVDYSKYLMDDIFEYLTKNKKFIYTSIQDILNFEELERACGYHTNPNFVYNLIKQMYYNNIFDYCNIKSKKLDYNMFFKINKIKILQQWTDFIKDFIPATTKWEYNNFLLKNTNLDNGKFLYKKYIIYNGLNTDENAQRLEYHKNDIDNCKPDFTDFEFNKNLPLSLEKVTNKIIAHNFDNQHYGMGRILTVVNDIKTTFDYPLVERN